MKNFLIIGLGKFSRCVLDCLVEIQAQVVVIDRDGDKIQAARDLATQAMRADVRNRDLLDEILPEGIECAIVDLGSQLHTTILVTNYLSKRGVPNIVVEATDSEQAEILQIVGATRIVFPEEEAAKRVVGLLTGERALDYFSVSDEFSMMELPIKKSWVGHTILELDLRRRRKVNVVALRRREGSEKHRRWIFADPEASLESDQSLLLAGHPRTLRKLADEG